MKRMCCCCQKILGQVEGSNEEITHTLCPPCLKELMSGCKTNMQTFLNTFEEPILLVDENGKVITANQSARESLNKPYSKIEGYMGGEVMECAYSGLDEGCGSTVHCKACTIRNLVMNTFETGDAFLNHDAIQDIKDETGPHKMHFLISTQKVNETVLLTIHESRQAD